jgi:molybdopterin-guanine dinucleotide biosynthesis protein A
MAISERPTRDANKSGQPEDKEKLSKLANAFISGADHAPAIENEEEGRTPVMVRYKKQMLKKIDAAAKRRGLSRSAWIQYAASRVLEMEEKAYEG